MLSPASSPDSSRIDCALSHVTSPSHAHAPHWCSVAAHRSRSHGARPSRRERVEFSCLLPAFISTAVCRLLHAISHPSSIQPREKKSLRSSSCPVMAIAPQPAHLTTPMSSGRIRLAHCLRLGVLFAMLTSFSFVYSQTTGNALVSFSPVPRLPMPPQPISSFWPIW